jgi:hypothetical protein
LLSRHSNRQGELHLARPLLSPRLNVFGQERRGRLATHTEKMGGLVIELERMDRGAEGLRLAGEDLLHFGDNRLGKSCRQRMLQQIAQSLDVPAQKCITQGIQIGEHVVLACVVGTLMFIRTTVKEGSRNGL